MLWRIGGSCISLKYVILRIPRVHLTYLLHENHLYLRILFILCALPHPHRYIRELEGNRAMHTRVDPKTQSDLRALDALCLKDCRTRSVLSRRKAPERMRLKAREEVRYSKSYNHLLKHTLHPHLPAGCSKTGRATLYSGFPEDAR